MEYTLVDTGIWIAMFDPRDQHRARVDEIAEYLDLCHLILPWPTLYETLRTRLTRNRNALQSFEAYLKRPRISFLDDEPYRETAIDLCFSSGLQANRPLSMVDCLLRLVLDDTNIKINYLATFNYSDFIDICQKRQIEIM
ncbi:MAG: type II toxin-antitoxin system VapC family toxin [Thermodesulfobacteriota bacterium]|nr:type II toxin-antitoxin system VapC family toxin [Thermodesulfobacteriota bacterium]